MKTELTERLLANSARAENGCLRWTGMCTEKGYGRISVDNRLRPVHVIAHEVWIGPVPDGYDVDHVHARGCRFRDCIEPSHLEAVTHAENVRRAMALITHCPKGHEYTPDNIRWVRPNPGQSARRRNCKRCFNASQKRRRAARKQRQAVTSGGE